MPDDDLIPLTHVARELAADGYTGKRVSYERVYRGVLSATIPAEQLTSNRWSVRRADLPKVAAALSLTPAREAEPSRSPVEQAA